MTTPGPAGAGTHTFPTDGPATISLAQNLGLHPELHLPNQPSKMAHKPQVTWTRLLLRKLS